MKNNFRNTSWIDLFILWVESLPIARWLFYSLLLLVLALLNFVIARFSPLSALELFYASLLFVVLLAAVHGLSSLARSAFDQFSPSLDDSKTPIDDCRRRFLVAPPWIGWLTLILGILVSADGGLYDVGITALTLFYMANSIRRLRLVILLHRQVDHIDLFHLSPLRAFSRFSSSTAIVLLMPILVGAPYTTIEPDTLIFYAVNGLLAMAVFILPLVGLRNRINAVRAERIQGIMEDVDLIARKAREAVQKGEEDRLGKLKSGLDLFLIQRNELRKVQTWPWKTSTIQGFLSAFLLPIIIWLITRILERVI